LSFSLSVCLSVCLSWRFSQNRLTGFDLFFFICLTDVTGSRIRSPQSRNAKGVYPSLLYRQRWVWTIKSRVWCRELIGQCNGFETWSEGSLLERKRRLAVSS
jgi:hypothetical protein